MEFLYEQLGLLGPAMAILILVLITAVIFLWKELSKKNKKIDTDKDKYVDQFKILSKEHQEIISKFNSELKGLGQSHSEQIERINKEHKEELKELNQYVRERETTHIQTIRDLITISEEVERNQEQMMIKLDNLK